MDKIFSTRIDEVVLNKISLLAHRLHVSKKKVIEGAIDLYAQQMANEADMDVLAKTSGAWKRKESAQETVARAKNAFRQPMR